MLVVALLSGCDRTPVLLEGTVTVRAAGVPAATAGTPPEVGSSVNGLPDLDLTQSFAPGIDVVLYADDAATPVAETTTNLVGHYTFRTSSLPGGTYRLRVGDVWWGGTSWATASPITVGSTPAATVDLQLPALGTVSGSIVDALRRRVPGVPVWATDASGAPVAITTTDATGTFTLGMLGAGAYTVRFHRSTGSITVGGASPAVFTVHDDGQGSDAGLVDVGTGERLALGDVSQVTAGDFHTCALRVGGTVSCWGMGSDGELGDGTSGDNALLPVTVEGIDDAVAVDAGRHHTCALREGGTVSCWGHNVNGELGDGSSELISTTPVQVVGISDAEEVAAGGFQTCALREGGTVSCWGQNDSGQLGDGTTADSPAPVTVAGLTDITAIATQGSHSCALHVGGTVSCWGSNTFGELGDGTTVDSSTPMTVSGVSDATAISVGAFHTCALRTGGSVSCWGWNSRGQLGNGTTDDSATPVSVSGITDATAIATFGHHSCVLVDHGSISCWGFNDDGELGNGTTGDATAPVPVSGIADATTVATGLSQSCAVRTGGNVSCWGRNSFGQLGIGTTDVSTVPVTVLAGE